MSVTLHRELLRVPNSRSSPSLWPLFQNDPWALCAGMVSKCILWDSVPQLCILTDCGHLHWFLLLHRKFPWWGVRIELTCGQKDNYLDIVREYAGLVKRWPWVFFQDSWLHYPWLGFQYEFPHVEQVWNPISLVMAKVCVPEPLLLPRSILLCCLCFTDITAGQTTVGCRSFGSLNGTFWYHGKLVFREEAAQGSEVGISSAMGTYFHLCVTTKGLATACVVVGSLVQPWPTMQRRTTHAWCSKLWYMVLGTLLGVTVI